ncbi:MAG TPA: hypothetical protein VLA43_05775, partial [Longimicrobiales bacterium]|nr:hypothetical protein [Longimicrobiales bacterium]
GQGEGRVQAIRGLERVAGELGSLVVEAQIPKVGQAASGTYEGEGSVIVRHPDTDAVKDALWKIITRIRVELG